MATTYLAGIAWETTPAIAAAILGASDRILPRENEADRHYARAEHYARECARREAGLPGSGAAYERAADRELAAAVEELQRYPLRRELLAESRAGGGE